MMIWFVDRFNKAKPTTPTTPTTYEGAAPAQNPVVEKETKQKPKARRSRVKDILDESHD